MSEIALLGFVLVLALGAWWSMVIFPRQRDFEKRQRFARTLALGDEVITYGGIVGKVMDIEDGVAYIEIADGVVVRMVTASIMQPFDAEEIARNARVGLEEEPEAAQETSR